MFVVRYRVVTYILSFFFNLLEKNLLIVKEFSKCHENNINRWQNGQLRRRRRRAYASSSNTASHDNHENINAWVSFAFL